MATETPPYWRPKGDKATARSYERDDDEEEYSEPPSRLWEDLDHGDLLHHADGYRGTDTWAVSRNADGSLSIECLGDDAGYAEIDATVSRMIEDPLDFYADFTDDHLYQGVTTVHFDACAHDDILQAQTGGRTVDQSRTVWWTTYNGCFEIAIPQSPDCPRGGSATLEEKTPDVYLTDVEEIDSDPATAEERETNRVRHEEKADEYFRGLKVGDPISLADFPAENPSGWGGAGGTFAWARPATGPVVAVGVKMHEGALVFARRKVPFETGPYGGINVWAGGNPRGRPKAWMINL